VLPPITILSALCDRRTRSHWNPPPAAPIHDGRPTPLRFLARQFGFMGSTPVEAARIDTICEHVRDIKDGYRKLMTLRDPAVRTLGPPPATRTGDR